MCHDCSVFIVTNNLCLVSATNHHTLSADERRKPGAKGVKPDRDFRIQQRYCASHRAEHFNIVKNQVTVVSVNTDTGQVRAHAQQCTRHVNVSNLFTEKPTSFACYCKHAHAVLKYPCLTVWCVFR